MHTAIALLILLLFAGLRPSSAAEVTSPTEFLGRPLGADFALADWSEVRGYYEQLAAQSPCVRLERIGTTSEGRDFLLATVTSAANQAQLETIRADCARIADPRGLTEAERARLPAEGKVVVFLSLAMHSTETAAPQFGMELAWLLATSDEEPWKTARDRLVVGILPCTNPDGLDHVVSWYRDTVGTPYENSGMLKLYQLYAGHDNNRDWFMLSQPETRLVSELLYSRWHPQVYWDVHQQGQTGERMFVPPFRDPLNPNLDPAIIAGINALGTRAQLDMVAEGKTGVATGVTFDMWWNGGNRNVPVRHNMIGLLTEAASVNIASPIFLERARLKGPAGGEYVPQNAFPAPWPGGWWRLRDIIDYELAFARSLFSSLAREPATWIGNAIAAAERSIAAGRDEAPVAWILPADNRDRGALRRLVDVLLATGVELHLADADFIADDRTWPAGSIVIRREQPYGNHVKDLFDVQRYPAGDRPYDVAGWSLPHLLGVRRVEVMSPLNAELRAVDSVAAAMAALPTRAGAGLDLQDSDTWRTLFRWVGTPTDDDGWSFVTADDELRAVQGVADQPGGTPVARPRIGLYSPWSGNMDEGWMRYVFDTFEVPYLGVTNEMIRADALRDFLDVLVIAGGSSRQLDQGREEGSIPPRYAGGLAPEGAIAIERFVRDGGHLLAVDDACAFAIDLFQLPVVDVTSAEGFACPGSVLRATAAPHPCARGLPDSIAVFFSGSAAFEVPAKIDNPHQASVATVLSYAASRTLISGYIARPEVIAGKAAWLRIGLGRGTIDLFGFRPQYRSWSQAAFQLLFRALLLPGT